MAEQLGMVTDELSNLDTLLQRLRAEVADADAVVMLPTLITAWTQVQCLWRPAKSPAICGCGPSSEQLHH